MSKYLRAFLDNVTEYMKTSTSDSKFQFDKDMIGVTAQIAHATESWLINNNLTSATEINPNVPVVANENYGISNLGPQLGVESIETFVRECGIHDSMVHTAVETVSIILHKHLAGRGASSAWREQNIRSTADNNTSVRDLNTVLPDVVLSELTSWSQPNAESFGVNMDSALPDMKVAITVALLRFHTSITNRILQVRPTPSPTITYIKENIEVIDLSDTSAVPKKVTELYGDPSLASNTLKTIIPLNANDDSNDVLVSDGIIKFAKTANLLELSIDSSKPGYTKINVTDTVADGASLGTVYVTLTDGTDTEQFAIVLPSNSARFTRPSNARDAAIRIANVKYTALLLSTTLTSAGATSDLLDTLEAGEGIAVTVTVRGELNLKTGDINCLCSVSAAAHHTVAGQSVSAAATTLIGLINGGTAPVANGYSVNAKHSEENLRKSNIQVRSQRQPFSYDIPVGRNYVYDYAIGQQSTEENAVTLSKIINIGQDGKTIDLITATLNEIYNQVQAAGTNPLESGVDVGTDYIAGAKIKAYVYTDTIDLDNITSLRDADRSGDIKERISTILNAVCVELMEKTYIRHQLPVGTKMTFKCITSGKILGNLLGVPHIHNHLETGAPGTGDVEYRLVLPSGVILEVATTTFDNMADKIILIPFIPGSPNSELNWGHHWDYGTMVGSFTSSGDGNFNRLFANARELTIPTAPLGAILDVINYDTAVFTSVS